MSEEMLHQSEIFGTGLRSATDHPAAHAQRCPTLTGILHDIEAFIIRYVVVSVEQVIAISLWVAHTHVIDASECTPYLQITSATKRAGKTRLQEVLEPLVARAWFTGRVSAAVLVRKVDAERPTLLLDESDAAFKSGDEYSEALRGILNTGYRRSGKASLCVGQGANITYRDFTTFGAKAIAGIGELPATVADRSIRIELRRRTSDESCARWRERDGRLEADPIRLALESWAKKGTIEALRNARPELPVGLSDRQADVWEPLLAIADSAEGQWPIRARKAALVLSGSLEDQDIVVELLRDIREIFEDVDAEAIATKDLIEKLVAADDRPWATWRHDKPITARGLARLLSPLGIHPSDQRIAGRHRSYRIDAFGDAFSRYLPIKVGKRETTNKTGPEPAISMWETEQREPRLIFADSPNVSGPDPACPLEKPVMRGPGDAGDF